ncbi:MAG: DNA repair protein RecO [Candidatus Goldbacteria bacterium]|nr:DNA repair protein RecO [Candidatus Goldiibacteriota bacterium]
MEIKTSGIVLKRFDRAENDNVTSVFTEGAGKIYVVSKGTRKPASRFKNSLELFSLSDFMLTRKNPDSRYFTLIQAKPHNSFAGIRSSLKKIALAYYIIELVEKFMQPEDINKEMYNLALKTLLAVETCGVKEAAEHGARFKAQLLKCAGFNPSDDAEFLDARCVETCVREQLKEMGSGDNGCYSDALNNILDSYITTVLEEEPESMKFYGSIK